MNKAVLTQMKRNPYEMGFRCSGDVSFSRCSRVKNLPEDNWSHLNLFLQDSPHGLADHSNGRGVDR